MELLLIIAIFPVIILGAYIYKKDKNKEPKLLLIKLFTSGILACLLVVIITLIATSIQLLITKLHNKNSKVVKKVKVENQKIPIGFYMCVANIVMLITTNFMVFYL